MLRLQSTRYNTLLYRAVHTVLFDCIHADGKHLETAYTAILHCDSDSAMDGGGGDESFSMVGSDCYGDSDDGGGGESYRNGR